MGSMDLAELGSADMEQLLQGVGVGDVYGGQALFGGGGGVDAAMGGAGDVLLRILDAPGLLQHVLQAGHAMGGEQGTQAQGARLQRAASRQRHQHEEPRQQRPGEQPPEGEQPPSQQGGGGEQT